MKHRQEPKRSYTIKQDGTAFKVFDASGKYRRPFATRAEAETYGASLSARRALERGDDAAELSEYETRRQAQKEIMEGEVRKLEEIKQVVATCRSLQEEINSILARDSLPPALQPVLF
jgi:hypothetical protein